MTATFTGRVCASTSKCTAHICKLLKCPNINLELVYEGEVESARVIHKIAGVFILTIDSGVNKMAAERTMWRHFQSVPKKYAWQKKLSSEEKFSLPNNFGRMC